MLLHDAERVAHPESVMNRVVYDSQSPTPSVSASAGSSDADSGAGGAGSSRPESPAP